LIRHPVIAREGQIRHENVDKGGHQRNKRKARVEKKPARGDTNCNTIRTFCSDRGKQFWTNSEGGRSSLGRRKRRLRRKIRTGGARYFEEHHVMQTLANLKSIRVKRGFYSDHRGENGIKVNSTSGQGDSDLPLQLKEREKSGTRD